VIDQEETRSMKTGRGVRKGSCLSPILFNLFSKCLTKKALEECGDIKIGDCEIGDCEICR